MLLKPENSTDTNDLFEIHGEYMYTDIVVVLEMYMKQQ